MLTLEEHSICEVIEAVANEKYIYFFYFVKKVNETHITKQTRKKHTHKTTHKELVLFLK